MEPYSQISKENDFEVMFLYNAKPSSKCENTIICRCLVPQSLLLSYSFLNKLVLKYILAKQGIQERGKHRIQKQWA